MIDTASEYRHLFPVFESVKYVNSCSQGALAIPVRNALNEYLDGMYEKGSLWDQWVMEQEDLRKLTAQVFSTNVANVAITASASAGINSVLSSFDFSNYKNQIVTTDLEFPTMGQILHSQERRGAEVYHLSSTPEGTFDYANFEKFLTEKTALVAITHVCFRNGNMTDVKSVTEIAHKHGIPVLVDAYQSAGSIPINFDDLGADFLVGGYLKYLLGIPGVGFLLAKPNSLHIPTNTGWFASRDVFAMRIDTYDPASDARRFSAGTPPIPSVYAAVAGLEVLLKVGIKNSWKHALNLHELLRDGLSLIGANFVTSTEEGSHGVMLALKSSNEQALVARMEEFGVIASSRNGNVRLSPHFYNNFQDIENVVRAIQKHRHLLG